MIFILNFLAMIILSEKSVEHLSYALILFHLASIMWQVEWCVSKKLLSLSAILLLGGGKSRVTFVPVFILASNYVISKIPKRRKFSQKIFFSLSLGIEPEASKLHTKKVTKIKAKTNDAFSTAKTLKGKRKDIFDISAPTFTPEFIEVLRLYDKK